MKSTKKSRLVTWLDLLSDRSDPRLDPVLAPGEIASEDAFGYDGVNIIYDYDTDTAFTVASGNWPPTRVVSETLDQYKPREL